VLSLLTGTGTRSGRCADLPSSDRGRSACVLVELLASLFGQTVLDQAVAPRRTL